MRRPTTPGRGEVGQTPGIAAVPRGRATFRGALPGVARPSGNEGVGVARGAPGGGAVAAVVLSRGRAISAAAMSRGRAISAAVVPRGGAVR